MPSDASPCPSPPPRSCLGLFPGVAAAYTTVHTGSGRPALALASNRLYAAWTGSTSGTSGKQLIVGWSGDGGQHFTKDNSVVERIPEGEGPGPGRRRLFGYAAASTWRGPRPTTATP